MEATATIRGGSMPFAPHPSRKEWRAVSDDHSVQSIVEEELERMKLGQSDERTIYEVQQQGREPLDMDFCSITIDGSLDNDLLQQRLHDISRQREELQRVEFELRAQMIARSEIMEIQNSFDSQLKEHANAATKFQEQLHERDQTIRELERKLEDKDRELHIIKLDNEAAWAKEDLLREQDKELASIRRERDHSDAERSQHIKQLHDLQEHIQEKERQLMELQEQQRVAQETIIYKDEQLREAQAWISRVQEMDALQSSTIQVELRERTEQYNHLWLGCQRQFVEMERLHMHTVQQLQLELADARERNGNFTDESHTQENSKDVSHFGQNNGNQLDTSAGASSGGNTVSLPNGNSNIVSSFASTVNASTQVVDHAAGVQLAPSIIGMPSYLPPGQMTTLHSFLMHQQGVPHSMSSHVAAQSHVGHFQSMSSLQQWHNQQAVSEGVKVSTQNEHTPLDQKLMRSDKNYNYEISVNGQAFHPDYLDVHTDQGVEPNAVNSSSIGEAQVLESIDGSYLATSHPEHDLQQISSQFHGSLRLESLQQDSETMAQKQSFVATAGGGMEAQVLTEEEASSVSNLSPSDGSSHQMNFDQNGINNATCEVLPEVFASTGQANMATAGRVSETMLLDERSLLACIARTIPPGGRIHISSTLPNRLGKMLAPLHWHDYKKKYGKLDDFVASHPDLFMIEDNYIQLREGAKEMIAAAAAAAKVAAAAAASSPYSSSLPTVAVTPMAQNQRLKQHNQQPNGVRLGVSGAHANISLLRKSKDLQEVNGLEARPAQSSVLLTVENGANLDRSNRSSSQSSGSTNGRSSSNYIAKQQGRLAGAAFSSRR